MELTESQLAQIDWPALSLAVLDQYWSLKTIDILQRVLLSIVEEEEEPTIDRLRLWLPLAQVESNRSLLVLGIIRRGPPLFCVKIGKDMKGQYEICKSLNNLRSRLIHFPYCFLRAKGMEPIVDEEIALTWMMEPSFSPRTYLFFEYVKGETMDKHIKEDSNEECLLSLFLQVFLAMKLAHEEISFFHGNLTTNNVIVENKGDRWIPLGDKWIRGEKIARICGIQNKRIEGRRPLPIYDIYTFAITIIRDLSLKRSFSHNFLNFLVDFLLSLGIPIYLITRVRTLVSNEEAIYSKLPSKVHSISYQTASTLFFSLCRKREIGIDRLYCSSLPSENVLDYSLPFSLPQGIHPLDAYIGMVAEDLNLDLVENPNAFLFSKAFDAAIKKLMENIEESFSDLNRGFRTVKGYTQQNVSLFSPQELERCINEFSDLFYDLLSVRVFLDDLRVKLRYREILRKDITNENIHNYLRENEAKLLRLAGENTFSYERASEIVDHRTLKRIERIWRILHDATIRTR